VTALSSVRDILGRLAETPEAAVALAGYLPPEAAAAVKGSAWYAEAVSGMAPDALDTAAADDQRGSASPRRLELGGITFIETAGGNFVTGGVVPRRVSTGDFWIAAAAVSPSSWEAFLAANPRWNVQNAVLLKEQGLVTEDYLVSFTGGPPDTGVSSVSWYAAQAFCEWFTSLLPPAFSSYEVRLPTELEWEYVASISSIRDTMGSLWEWCKDPYVPLDFFPATEEAAALIGSPERSLRGGSWINQPGSVNTATRASLPPQICSPFVSFRPIIVLKEGAGSE
jgi:formylglycine-generating enzyme required for sulfatase activity